MCVFIVHIYTLQAGQSAKSAAEGAEVVVDHVVGEDYHQQTLALLKEALAQTTPELSALLARVGGDGGSGGGRDIVAELVQRLRVPLSKCT